MDKVAMLERWPHRGRPFLQHVRVECGDDMQADVGREIEGNA